MLLMKKMEFNRNRKIQINSKIKRIVQLVQWQPGFAYKQLEIKKNMKKS